MIDGRTACELDPRSTAAEEITASGKTSLHMYASTERSITMATKKVASLSSTLLARKGEAGPANVVTPTPARDETVKLTVKLTPDEHMWLLQLGLRSRPRRSNQEMIRDAVLQYLDAEEQQ
jgi:hypothetical protein